MAMSKIVVPHLIHLFIRPFDFRFNAGVAASTPGGVLKPRACHHLVLIGGVTDRNENSENIDLKNGPGRSPFNDVKFEI